MTPEQQKLQDLQLESQFLVDQNKTMQADDKARAVQIDMDDRVKKITDGTGATKEELDIIRKEAVEAGFADVTPEELGSIYTNRKLGTISRPRPFRREERGRSAQDE